MMPASPPAAPPPGSSRRGHTRTAVLAAGLAVTMVGAAYAAVPLYDLFCRVTGFGGTPMAASAPAGTILDRKVTVRFDSNVAPGLGWRFRSEVPKVDVRIGETHEVRYTVRNDSSVPATGVATFNVTPPLAGSYFAKLECFCYTDKTLQPGESFEATVVFYVDPAIVENSDIKDINAITLSYTFFPAKAQPVAAVAPNAADKPKL